MPADNRWDPQSCSPKVGKSRSSRTPRREQFHQNMSWQVAQYMSRAEKVDTGDTYWVTGMSLGTVRQGREICILPGLSRGTLTTQYHTHGHWSPCSCKRSRDTKSLHQQLNVAVEDHSHSQFKANCPSKHQVQHIPMDALSRYALS